MDELSPSSCAWLQLPCNLQSQERTAEVSGESRDVYEEVGGEVGRLVGKRKMKKGRGVRGLTFLSVTFLSVTFSSVTFSACYFPAPACYFSACYFPVCDFPA